MSRTVKEVQLDQPLDVVSMMMDDFIYHNHFMRTDWQGEMVFSSEDSNKGVKYFKWSYAGGLLRTEAWVKGAFGGEDGLVGLYQGALKRQFAADLEQLYRELSSASDAQFEGGHIGSDPLHHGNGVYSNHESWAQDTMWQQSGYDRTAEDYEQQESRGQDDFGTAFQPGSYSEEYSGGRSIGRPDPKILQLCLMAVVMGLFIPIAGLIIAVIAKARAKGTESEHTANVLCRIAFIIIMIRFVFSMITPIFMLFMRAFS